jgi:hypothetical protein
MASAIKRDASSTKMIVNGIDAMNCPVMPEMVNSGANTAIVVRVPEVRGE